MGAVDQQSPVPLRRSVGVVRLVLYGIGTILGAGIYVLVGEVASHAGTATPSAFVVAALLAGLTGMSFAELSSRFPKSAGEAIYVHQGLGSRALSTVVGLMVALIGIVSAATIAVGFAGYLDIFVELPHWLTIVLLVLGLGAVATWGIEASVTVAALMTVVEVGGLLLILVVAGDSLADLPARANELVPALDRGSLGGFFVGSFVAFFAFVGFEDMVNVAEEVKDPRRTMPLSIGVAIAITMVLYLVVSLTCVLSLPIEALSGSETPLADVYRNRTGHSPVVISGISLVAVSNGALIQLIMSARVLYGSAKQGWLPRRLASVHPRTQTPIVATALVTVIVVVLAIALSLSVLAQATSFITLTVFALVNLSLWRIKGGEPQPEALSISIPRWVPLLGFLASSGVLGLRLVELAA